MKLYFVSSIFHASKPKEGKDITDSLKYAKCIYLLERHKFNMSYFPSFEKLFYQNEYTDENCSFLRHFYNIFGSLDKIELFNLLRLCPRNSHI